MACFWQDNELTTEDCGGGGDWVNVMNLRDDLDIWTRDGFFIDGDGFTLNRVNLGIYTSLAIVEPFDSSSIVIADARVTVLNYVETPTAGGADGVYPSRVVFFARGEDFSRQVSNMNSYPASRWDPEQTLFTDVFPSGFAASRIQVSSSEIYSGIKYSATGRVIIEVLLG